MGDSWWAPSHGLLLLQGKRVRFTDGQADDAGHSTTWTRSNPVGKAQLRAERDMFYGHDNVSFCGRCIICHFFLLRFAILKPLMGGVSVHTLRSSGYWSALVSTASTRLACGSASMAAHMARAEVLWRISNSRCCCRLSFPKRIMSARSRTRSSGVRGGGGRIGRRISSSFRWCRGRLSSLGSFPGGPVCLTRARTWRVARRAMVELAVGS